MAKQSVTEAMAAVLLWLDGERATGFFSQASIKACVARGLVAVRGLGHELTDAGRSELAAVRKAQAEARWQERLAYRAWRAADILGKPAGGHAAGELSEAAQRALRYYAGAGEFSAWGAAPPADLAEGTRELVAGRHVRACGESYELTTSGAALAA